MPVLKIHDTAEEGFRQRLDELLNRAVLADSGIEDSVRNIVERVRCEGDSALLDLTRTLDQVDITCAAELEIPAGRLESALADILPQQRIALEHAAARLRDYHQHQRQESWEFTDDDGNLLFMNLNYD